MSKARILIIDDEKNIRKSLTMILESEGYSVESVESGEEGLSLVEKEAFDLAILDVWLPGMDGIRVLQKLKEINPELMVVVISGHANVQTAVDAIKSGAYDFLEKPLTKERTLLTVQNGLEKRKLIDENKELKVELNRNYQILGKSEPIKQIWGKIKKSAPSRGRILIVGEHGTGKELIARAIHEYSNRSDSPFIKVNCAAIPEDLIESELFGHEKGSFTGATAKRIGKFEQADGGTIFLDEVGDMSLKTQAKVLRVLQEEELTRVGGNKNIEVNVRVISATNKNLEDEIKAGNFREDLYYRLNVIPIYSPPLRDHKADIPLLVDHFINEFCRLNGFKPKELSDEALKLLMSYNYPGNVRELKNIIERIVIMTSGDTIDADDLPNYITQKQIIFRKHFVGNKTLSELRKEVEREYIVAKLEENEGNVTQTAKSLGIERTNLYKKMKYYDIDY